MYHLIGFCRVLLQSHCLLLEKSIENSECFGEKSILYVTGTGAGARL